MRRRLHSVPILRPSLARLPALPRGTLAPVRALLALAALTFVGGCAMMETYYPAKGDSRPHPGVARAHRLPIHGIDISKWQGDIDWKAVRDAGTQFVFIKATEGGDHVDERFLTNWYGAKAAGIPRGAYHFVYWCRPAHEQAQWFKQHIPNDPDALPPVLDVEWNGHSKTCPQKVPREDALEKIKLMLAELEAHTGKRPIIYTDIPFHRDVLEGELKGYAFWIRSTAAEPHERYAGREDWTFWQFTTTGRVPGIRGNVDRNAFFSTAEVWEKFKNGEWYGGTETASLD
ncbi:GH25 family lysozyme [Chelatococcus sp. SYSU_G07232]|uniref:GH25 family lysozyme n=1 Tax=Chelatococcus albus TaxID=3047466 RepID=A0ABT7AD26_9HYPH|nr:GH25 family lysozyme [Chelatococcus sp. SYSU_G07232]MDJ1157238.1 GH25 family lysozyme [Chelatococcus sp. SYSU_G07232]